MPARVPAVVEDQIVTLRRVQRCGPDGIAAELGVAARTVSRVLHRHGVPYLRNCDPMTGELIRASKTTAVRYERARPGELVHMDVKKLGRTPRAVAGVPTAETTLRDLPRPAEGLITCIHWSTTIPGWPIPRYCPTRKATPARGF
jgi:hypothetical protein